MSAGGNIRALLIEAADSVRASLAEDGISDDRKAYRADLEARLRAAAEPEAKADPMKSFREFGEMAAGLGKAMEPEAKAHTERPCPICAAEGPDPEPIV